MTYRLRAWERLKGKAVVWHEGRDRLLSSGEKRPSHARGGYMAPLTHIGLSTAINDTHHAQHRTAFLPPATTSAGYSAQRA